MISYLTSRGSYDLTCLFKELSQKNLFLTIFGADSYENKEFWLLADHISQLFTYRFHWCLEFHTYIWFQYFIHMFCRGRDTFPFSCGCQQCIIISNDIEKNFWESNIVLDNHFMYINEAKSKKYNYTVHSK